MTVKMPYWVNGEPSMVQDTKVMWANGEPYKYRIKPVETPAQVRTRIKLG